MIAIVKLMMKLHKESTIQVGENEVNAEMGLPQGSVLSPSCSMSTLKKLSDCHRNWRM
jgi:hypothetical protein